MQVTTKMSPLIPKNQAPITENQKRFRALVLRGFVILLLLALVSLGIHSLFFAGLNSGPTLIDELRAGRVSEGNIKSIEILKFDPGAGWPFSEPAYARKARKVLDIPATKELVRVLRSTTDGHKHRNHPATFYYGILRIDLVQGGHFYVFYHLGYYNNQYYVYVDANSKDSTNPNGAAEYENVPLADFLQRNDPWYRNLDSPTTRHRPSAPDDVP
jgi:hypothetical protein